MKTFSTKTVEAPALAEVRCNLCGRVIEKNKWGYVPDHLSIQKTWGYHSPADGEAHDFEICADCYFNWIKGFVISPRVEEASAR